MYGQILMQTNTVKRTKFFKDIFNGGYGQNQPLC